MCAAINSAEVEIPVAMRVPSEPLPASAFHSLSLFKETFEHVTDGRGHYATLPWQYAVIFSRTVIATRLLPGPDGSKRRNAEKPRAEPPGPQTLIYWALIAMKFHGSSCPANAAEYRSASKPAAVTSRG